MKTINQPIDQSVTENVVVFSFLILLNKDGQHSDDDSRH